MRLSAYTLAILAQTSRNDDAFIYASFARCALHGVPVYFASSEARGYARGLRAVKSGER